MDKLEEIFKLQTEFQESLGFYFDDGSMSSPERVEYIRDMVLASLDELHEALHEVSWKPWANSLFINRDALAGELVDVLHFFVNLCLVIGLSPSELHARYTAKREINLNRQAAGYDGVSTKCSRCKRALDDPEVQCTREQCAYDNGND